MTPNPTEPAAPASKILIVDDIAANIQLLGSVLRGEGLQVIPAMRGEEALRAAAKHAPDLILLDVMMPEMDGYEVIKRLKADPATADIPVIFVTALADQEDEAKGLQLGAVDYITKPIKIPVALSRVRTHLALRAAYREVQRQNQRLIEAAALREDVERMTRHDLKSPLSGIIGFSSLIGAPGNLNAQQVDMVQRIKANGYRILEMIDRSLDMYKMEQGTYRFEPEEVDVLEVLREIVFGFQRLASTKAIEFEILVDGVNAGAEERVIAKAEKLLCHSMFSNLVKNALEASPDACPIRIQFMRAGNATTVRIENHGETPVSIRPTFFEKYVTSGKAKGTGLGTYSAALIARTLGATIQLDASTPGMTALVVTWRAD